MNVELFVYDMVVYIYALSLLFYFSDFISNNRKAKRLGTGLLVFVWILSFGFILIRFIHEWKQPIFEFSSFDLLHLFSWILITVAFIISRYYKIDLLVFFVNIVGFSILALNLYSSPREGQSLELYDTTRELLYIHISLIVSAYAFLTIGALFALMYLFLHYRLKQKKWTKLVTRFPSLEVMERFMERMVIIGFPLLLMSLAIAAISLIIEGKAEMLFDLSIIISFFALMVYGYYIYEKAINRKSGQQIAKLYLFAYLFQLVNMFFESGSSFH